MKKRMERSPGRDPWRGKKQAGILARVVTTFESEDELRGYFHALNADADRRPVWEKQCADFETFARQFSDDEMLSSDLTIEGKSSEVLWWIDCLRACVERGDTAASTAEAAMRLSAKMVELMIMANEEEILVGTDQMARPKGMEPGQTTRQTEHSRWRTEADLIRAERTELKSARSIAGDVKRRLGLTEEIGTIRKRI